MAYKLSVTNVPIQTVIVVQKQPRIQQTQIYSTPNTTVRYLHALPSLNLAAADNVVNVKQCCPKRRW